MGPQFHKIVLRSCGDQKSFNVTEKHLLESIKGKDSIEQERIIYDTLWPVILLRQGQRAAGIGAAKACSKAAAFIADQRAKFLAEHPEQPRTLEATVPSDSSSFLQSERRSDNEDDRDGKPPLTN